MCNQVASPWLRITEAASYARMGKDEMRALVHTGSIKSHKDPKKTNGTLIHAGDIDEYLMSLPSAARVPEELMGKLR